MEGMTFNRMGREWRKALFVAAVVFFAIILLEAATGNVMSGNVEFRFIPDAPQETIDASQALISSRELAERLQSWLRDRTFIREIEENSGSSLTSRSRFLPPVSAFMPAPDTIRMRVEAKHEDNIRRFVSVAEDTIREKVASYGVPGVRLEISSLVIEGAPSIRFTTILGAFLLALVSGLITGLLFAEGQSFKKSSRRPESSS